MHTRRRLARSADLWCLSCQRGAGTHCPSSVVEVVALGLAEPRLKELGVCDCLHAALQCIATLLPLQGCGCRLHRFCDPSRQGAARCLQSAKARPTTLPRRRRQVPQRCAVPGPRHSPRPVVASGATHYGREVVSRRASRRPPCWEPVQDSLDHLQAGTDRDRCLSRDSVENESGQSAEIRVVRSSMSLSALRFRSCLFWAADLCVPTGVALSALAAKSQRPTTRSTVVVRAFAPCLHQSSSATHVAETLAGTGCRRHGGSRTAFLDSVLVPVPI